MSGRRIRFAVTGATGEVGRLVAEGIAARGLAQRVIVRDPARAPRLAGAEVAVVSGYSDARAQGAALSGGETRFLVSAHDIMGVRHRALMSGQPVPAYDRVREHAAAVTVATAAGVERIVYLSFVNPSAEGTFILGRDHFHTEEFIRSTGLAFTFLRQNMYMDKVLQHVSHSDVIHAPAADGRVAWVSRGDVAAAAIGALAGAGHEGQTYDLTGPEALTMAETAERLANVLGRPITYQPQTADEARTLRNTSRMEEMDAARRERTGQGLSDEDLDIWISHYVQIARGEVEKVSDAVPLLSGRSAESLEHYLVKHAAG